jgi:hypothetical protein
MRKRESEFRFPFLSGAAEESRTLDLNLGKVALYQLSYCRKIFEARAVDRTDLHGFVTRRTPLNSMPYRTSYRFVLLICNAGRIIYYLKISVKHFLNILPLAHNPEDQAERS